MKIGASLIQFFDPERARPNSLKYSDAALGGTQIAVPAHSVLLDAPRAAVTNDADAELLTLRRKADILAMLYELTRTFNSVFDLKTLFDKATDTIFRVTPADRVVALLGDGPVGANECAKLKPVGTRTRLKQEDDSSGAITISRTILNKVLGERVALLSQDAAADSQLAHAKSIVSQGVRSTICAPLVTESGVLGVIYAGRLDPAAVFTRDDLEFISAIASQTAVPVFEVGWYQ
jgi:adenylate cyclase